MMNKLNNILRETGVSKVKFAKYLGVSRQMIYNYLEIDNIDDWPADKKMLVFNLLGIKKSEEIYKIKVNANYINKIEARINTVRNEESNISDDSGVFDGLGKKERILLKNLIDVIKENLEEQASDADYNSMKYLYNFLQSLNNSSELRYFLAYVAKETCFEEPDVFAFDEEQQYVFESIMFTAMTLYNNGGTSKTKLTEAHNRFVKRIERKKEEKMGRTMELTRIRLQAMQELGFSEVNEENVALISEKMAEIETRKVND